MTFWARPFGPARRAEFRALMFLAPALLVVGAAFLLPMIIALAKSVQNGELSQTLPALAEQMQNWNGEDLPPVASIGLFVSSLREAGGSRALGPIGRRLNMEIPGYSTLLAKTERALRDVPADTDPFETLRRIDARWSERTYWLALKRAAPLFTDHYFLAAFDLRRDEAGKIVPVDDDRSLYLDVILRSISIAFCVTLGCLIIGYPMSYLLAGLPQGQANILLLFVLFPFWTSILVRSAAWIVLLQREGLVNNALLAVGAIAAPISLIFNRTGVVIALTQVLLPYMILTLYSVMRGLDRRLVPAAASLGASPWQAFWRVYVPLTLPGVGAGCLLVFILAIGSYVTPALIGGRQDQMLSYYIAFNINQTVNWGLAAALSVVLVVLVFLLYFAYARIVGLNGARAA